MKPQNTLILFVGSFRVPISLRESNKKTGTQLKICPSTTTTKGYKISLSLDVHHFDPIGGKRVLHCLEDLIFDSKVAREVLLKTTGLHYESVEW